MHRVVIGCKKGCHWVVRDLQVKRKQHRDIEKESLLLAAFLIISCFQRICVTKVLH